MGVQLCLNPYQERQGFLEDVELQLDGQDNQARTMTYQAQVLKLSEEIEEKVLLRIGDIDLWCFASVAPYALEVGMSCPVELTLMVVDDYRVVPAERGAAPSLVRIGEGFEYSITGKLDGALLKVGELVFEDDTLLSNFGYLDQQMVQVSVARIDADFLGSGLYRL